MDGVHVEDITRRRAEGGVVEERGEGEVPEETNSEVS